MLKATSEPPLPHLGSATPHPLPPDSGAEGSAAGQARPHGLDVLFSHCKKPTAAPKVMPQALGISDLAFVFSEQRANLQKDV